MLVLSRKQGESIVVRDDIVVTVIELRGGRVRLGVEAPGEVSTDFGAELDQLGAQFIRDTHQCVARNAAQIFGQLDLIQIRHDSPQNHPPPSREPHPGRGNAEEFRAAMTPARETADRKAVLVSVRVTDQKAILVSNAPADRRTRSMSGARHDIGPRRAPSGQIGACRAPGYSRDAPRHREENG